MRITFIDILLTTIATSILLTLNLGTTYMFSSFLSRPYLGDYFVLFDFLFILLSYGVTTGFLVQLLLWFFPLSPGMHELDSKTFMQWKVITFIIFVGKKALSPYTIDPTRPLIEKIYGAKIGKNVAIAGTLLDSYFITLEDNSVVGYQAVFSAHFISRGKFFICPARLRKNSILGASSVSFCCDVDENTLIYPLEVKRPTVSFSKLSKCNKT